MIATIYGCAHRVVVWLSEGDLDHKAIRASEAKAQARMAGSQSTVRHFWQLSSQLRFIPGVTDRVADGK
jgi:hypothetical protein